jgi:GAF domain-containing protein
MVLVVVLVVTPGRRVAALLAGVSAGTWFDFFLTRPYESFTISHSADIQTSAMLVVVAVAVGELAARERRHKSESTTGNDALEAAQRVSGLVADGASAEAVVAEVNAALMALLYLRACRFDATRTAVTVPFVERPGYVSYTAFRWDTVNDGLPVGEVGLPVRFEHRLLGLFVLEGGDPPVPVAPQRLRAAVLLADLAGLAIAGDRRPHLSVMPA